MDPATVIGAAPPAIELGGEQAATSHLDEALVAIQGGGAQEDAIAVFEGGDVIVTALDAAPSSATGARIGPVYRQRGGGLAVPTGRVLVRFEPQDEPEAHAEDLGAAGFKLDEVLGYAPHAAWVRPHDDEPVAALGGLEKLRSLPGVEHVEPQVLTESAPREP